MADTPWVSAGPGGKRYSRIKNGRRLTVYKRNTAAGGKTWGTRIETRSGQSFHAGQHDYIAEATRAAENFTPP